jgi:hypothetical protein
MVITWQNIGILSNFDKINGNGVYLYVYNNEKIIYVGTAFRINNKGLYKELRKNVNLFKYGGRTLRVPDPNEDIYNLFKYEENYKTEIEYEENKKLWIPSITKINYKYISKFNQEFTKEWENIAYDYINKINVYVTFIENKQSCIMIESKIQDVITNYFELGEYTATNGRKSGKLGKQSMKGEVINNFNLVFKGDLLVDEKTKAMINKHFI